jgi:hypothetical protein
VLRLLRFVGLLGMLRVLGLLGLLRLLGMLRREWLRLLGLWRGVVWFRMHRLHGQYE